MFPIHNKNKMFKTVKLYSIWALKRDIITHFEDNP